MANSALGTRLKQVRKLRKLTQTQLATKASIKQSSVSELETGETKEISGPVLMAISKALKVRSQWLLSGDEPMEPSGSDLKTDEWALVKKYREATPTWRTALQGLAALRPDQQDWVMENVLERVFQPAATDERVSQYIAPAPHVVKTPTGQAPIPVRLAHRDRPRSLKRGAK